MRNLFFILISLVIVVSQAWAQKILPARKSVSALRHTGAVVQEIPSEVSMVLGNYKIGFLAPQPKHYTFYLSERFLGHPLNYTAYPVLAPRNDARIFHALRDFAKQAVRFETDFPRITSQIENYIFTKEISYTRFLPQDIDVLYIGEVHNETRVQKEIISLVRQLPSIYPGRTIYLAAEGIPTLAEWMTEKNIILTLDELAERIDLAAPIKSIRVLTAALDAQIPLYGLEDEVALILASRPPKQKLPTMKQYDDYAVSLEGMNFRNRLFARKIRELQVYDPGALIVVYGGIDHMAYHSPSALPSMIKGKSFVVQVTIPSQLGVSNPLFAHMTLDESSRQQFHSSPDAKIVESWKTPTSYNRLLGNDLTVIVHE